MYQGTWGKTQLTQESLSKQQVPITQFNTPYVTSLRPLRIRYKEGKNGRKERIYFNGHFKFKDTLFEGVVEQQQTPTPIKIDLFLAQIQGNSYPKMVLIILLAGKPVSMQLLDQKLCGCEGHLEVQEIRLDLFCLQNHITPSRNIKGLRSSYTTKLMY